MAVATTQVATGRRDHPGITFQAVRAPGRTRTCDARRRVGYGHLQ